MQVIILSGGVGSRLWPVSRKSHPKPFIQAPNGLSIFQNTISRSLDLSTNGLLHITSQEFLFKIKSESQAILSQSKQSIDSNYLLEPFPKGTAAAIALAGLWVKAHVSPEEILLILPSDHLIAQKAAFIDAVQAAQNLAKQGKIVTFGITPSLPETGYGYIEYAGNTVKRFVEKPSLEQAEAYLASGQYLWNSGMFCCQAKTLLSEMAQHCPDILSQVSAAYEQMTEDHPHEFSPDPTLFSRTREDSIDYAVLEKSQNIAVVPCDIGWTDIGTWTSFGELFERDNEDNVLRGHTLTQHTHNCYIESPHKLVSTLGVQDLVIVDTPDALLVAHKDQVQNVKHLYQHLAKSAHPTHEHHTTVHRPWGTYTVIEEGPHFKIKRIEVLPGAKLSLQSHQHRSEHWVVVSGQAKVINGEAELQLKANESTYIPAGHRHRLSNPSQTETVVIIEIQTGTYLGEDDIQRFEDIYNRPVKP